MNGLLQCWKASWQALGAQPDCELLERVLQCYREPHRHYHTLQHLQECLNNLELFRGAIEHPGEVALALFFHDAIYDVKRTDNEERSAGWAREAALASAGARESADRLQHMILATQHSALPTSNDERILIDLDLWILAAPAARFEEYERQVRAEYAWVPSFLFKRKRRAILGHFLSRPRIYSTELFQTRFEQSARLNLQRALQTL